MRREVKRCEEFSKNKQSETTAEPNANVMKSTKDVTAVPPKEATKEVADLQDENTKEPAEVTPTRKA